MIIDRMARVKFYQHSINRVNNLAVLDFQKYLFLFMHFSGTIVAWRPSATVAGENMLDIHPAQFEICNLKSSNFDF